MDILIFAAVVVGLLLIGLVVLAIGTAIINAWKH